MGWHLVHLVCGVQVEAHGATHAAIEACDSKLVLERCSACLSKVITELLVKHLLWNSLRSCSWVRRHHELSIHIHLWHLLRDLHLSLCLCLYLSLCLCLHLHLSLCLSLSLLVLLLHHKLTLPSPGWLNIHAHLRVHHWWLLWARLENIFWGQNGLGEEKVIWFHDLFVLMHLVLHIHLVLELLQLILIPIFLLHHFNLLLEVGWRRRATAYAIFILLAELRLYFHSIVSLLLLLHCFLRCSLLLLLLVLYLVYVGLLVYMTRCINALISHLGLCLASGILFHFFVDLLCHTIVDFLFLIYRYCLCWRLLHRNSCCHNGLRMHLRLLGR